MPTAVYSSSSVHILGVNCAILATSTKFSPTIVFHLLKKIAYGATWKKIQDGRHFQDGRQSIINFLWIAVQLVFVALQPWVVMYIMREYVELIFFRLVELHHSRKFLACCQNGTIFSPNCWTSAHLPTGHSLFHAHVPLSATEVSLSQDRVCGTVYRRL